MLQASGNLLISGTLLVLNGYGTSWAKKGAKSMSAGVSVRDWLIVSLGYLGAHFFGLSALRYIPFPIQVVCKSCKAVPVMFGEKILARKKHSREKEMSVSCAVFRERGFCSARTGCSASAARTGPLQKN